MAGSEAPPICCVFAWKLKLGLPRAGLNPIRIADKFKDVLLRELLYKKYVTVNGYRILTRFSAGQAEYPGPAVICVPGLALSGRYMVPAGFHLSRTLPVYIPDFPGLGDSQKTQKVFSLSELADFTVEWMRKLGLEKAVFLGNSYGAQIVTEIAVRRPEKVLAAVLIGLSADPKNRTYWRQFCRWLTGIFFESPAEFPIVTGDYFKCGFRQVLKSAHFCITDRVEKRLPRLRCPVLLMRGEFDFISPQRWMNEAAEMIPHSEKYVIPRKGHTPNFNAGPEIAWTAIDFLLRNGVLPRAEEYAA